MWQSCLLDWHSVLISTFSCQFIVLEGVLVLPVDICHIPNVITTLDKPVQFLRLLICWTWKTSLQIMWYNDRLIWKCWWIVNVCYVRLLMKYNFFIKLGHCLLWTFVYLIKIITLIDLILIYRFSWKCTVLEYRLCYYIECFWKQFSNIFYLMRKYLFLNKINFLLVCVWPAVILLMETDMKIR